MGKKRHYDEEIGMWEDYRDRVDLFGYSLYARQCERRKRRRRKWLRVLKFLAAVLVLSFLMLWPRLI